MWKYQKIGIEKPKSIAHDALKYALLTPKEFVPIETRKKLHLFT